MPPEYIYEDPITKKRISRFQSVHDEHSYSIGGVKWDRVWDVPQIATDMKMDENNPKQFLTKTSKGGSLGDLFDRASDASEARAQKNGGIDPVSGKKFEPKRTKGKKTTPDIEIG